MMSTSNMKQFNPFARFSAGVAVAAAAINDFAAAGRALFAPGRIDRGHRAGQGLKAPNPAGTKLARKARERKLGLRWC